MRCAHIRRPIGTADKSHQDNMIPGIKGLQIFAGKAGVLGNTRQHFRTEFLRIPKGPVYSPVQGQCVMNLFASFPASRCEEERLEHVWPWWRASGSRDREPNLSLRHSSFFDRVGQHGETPVPRPWPRPLLFDCPYIKYRDNSAAKRYPALRAAHLWR